MNPSDELISIKAGEKVELFSRSFSSVPMCYEFSASAADNQPLSGQVHVVKKNSFGNQTTTKKALAETNAVKATMWDTFVTIYVVAENDLKVTTPKRRTKQLLPVLLLSLLLIAIASVVLILQIQ